MATVATLYGPFSECYPDRRPSAWREYAAHGLLFDFEGEAVTTVALWGPCSADATGVDRTEAVLEWRRARAATIGVP